MSQLNFTRLDGLNIILLILASMLWWANKTLDQSQGPGSAILSSPSSEITVIHVVKNNRLQLALERKQDRWEINHPFPAAANSNKVLLLLALSKARSLLQLDARQYNLADFGFSNKNLQVSFNQHTLKFGGISEPAGLRYVLYNDQIYLIDDAYHRISGLPARHYLSQKP